MERPSAVAPSSWRAWLLALCLCCAAINAYSLFSDAVLTSSALGFQVANVDDPSVVRVDSVDAGGAAQASGLRAGDLIHIRDLSPEDRYRLFTGVNPHQRMPVTVSRGGQTQHLTYASGNALAWRWDIYVWCAASFWMLGFATLIAWRRPASAEARILCAILSINTAAAGLQAGSWLTPWPFADLIAACAGYALTWIAAALLATYAALFGRPLSAPRRVLTVLTYASCAAVATYEVVRLAMLWTGAKAWVGQTLSPDATFPWGAVPYILALACAYVAISSAHGSERSRMAWSTIPLGVYYLAQGLAFLVPFLFPSGQLGGALISAYQFINVGAFLAPLGMTYALFNRRLLDVGFVLNRVAIFSTVSLLIVGLFILAEWAIGTWLQLTNHTAGLIVDATVALSLGVSARYLHERVEHVLDRLFFRKRHEDEQALRAFAHESAYFTDEGALLRATERAIKAHADASTVGFALADSEGRFASIDGDDPALVKLRAWHKRLDLHDVQTSLHGEYAYPMAARGRFVGALIIGPKRSGESYAPDESDAILHIAASVGNALEVLSLKSDGSRDDLVQAVRAAVKDEMQSTMLRP